MNTNLDFNILIHLHVLYVHVHVIYVHVHVLYVHVHACISRRLVQVQRLICQFLVLFTSSYSIITIHMDDYEVVYSCRGVQ